jgi:flavin-dependent dehydrogenase
MGGVIWLFPNKSNLVQLGISYILEHIQFIES